MMGERTPSPVWITQRLNDLVKRAKTARHHDKGLDMFHEHNIARDLLREGVLPMRGGNAGGNEYAYRWLDLRQALESGTNSAIIWKIFQDSRDPTPDGAAQRRGCVNGGVSLIFTMQGNRSFSFHNSFCSIFRRPARAASRQARRRATYPWHRKRPALNP